jgi:hypothetical protein
MPLKADDNLEKTETLCHSSNECLLTARKDGHFLKQEYRNMTRQEANIKILELIAARVNDFPDLRFNQILVGLNITKSKSGSYYQETHNVIDFYEEPVVTLQRIVGEKAPPEFEETFKKRFKDILA